MIHRFIKKFTEKRIEVIKTGKKYYLANKKMNEEMKKIHHNPENQGLFLGEEKNSFKPSLALLSLVAENSKQKVFLNDMGEIDFLYGRNLRKRHIKKTEADMKPGFFVLVQNEHDENLGYGKVESADKIKNLLDRGDYLRREK